MLQSWIVRSSLPSSIPAVMEIKALRIRQRSAGLDVGRSAGRCGLRREASSVGYGVPGAVQLATQAAPDWSHGYCV